MTFRHLTRAASALPLLALGACSAAVDSNSTPTESSSEAPAKSMVKKATAPSDAPNVIFILVDDMGY